MEDNTVLEFDGDESSGRKKPRKIIIVGGIVALILLLIFVLTKVFGGSPKTEEPSENAIKQQVVSDYYSKLSYVLNQYGSGELILELADLNLTQEWIYVNSVPVREAFLNKVGSSVRFDVSTQTVTVPDYSVLQESVNEDRLYIENMYRSAGYSEDDYEYEENMFNLFCQYFVDKATIQTMQVDLKVPDSRDIIVGDVYLDDLLFGSDELRGVYETFSKICVGWTGLKDETYTVKEEMHNTEYDEWYALFKSYYDSDKGKFSKRSKWEPWYLRDENDKYILDENGEKVVNYYSIKDVDGNDWIQPDETILTDVEKVRQVEDVWVEERGIPYSMVGINYIKTKYNGEYSTAYRVGNGTVEHPAGVGTSIVTKVLCDDGKYRDVRVSLQGYWINEDAITYVEKFSTRNKGFTPVSVVKLVTYEISIENLSKETITFTSEMSLCDKNANISSRTGTIYGFMDSLTLQPGETGLINDWATSTELEFKYAVWGKSFSRNYPMVYFRILAGDGAEREYNSYEQFTGKKME